MIWGYNSVREKALPDSNRLKRGELSEITCNVESSNLSTPTNSLTFKNHIIILDRYDRENLGR